MRPIFTFRWLRRLVRKNMNPVSNDKAALWSQRLSRLYVFFALNMTVLIIYTSYNEDLDMWGRETRKMSTVDRYRRLAKGQEVEVYQVRGLHVASHHTIPANPEEAR